MIFTNRLLKKSFNQKLKCFSSQSRFLHGYLTALHLLLIFAADFGCYLLQFMLEMFSKLQHNTIGSDCSLLLESEQTPISWTGSQSRSAALHSI